MAAHRYWRFFCQTTVGGVFAIAEFTGSITVGGSNAFTGGTAASSSFFGGFPASQGFDGNPSTAWASSSNSSGEWLSYDLGLGNDKDLIDFSIAARNDNSANQIPATGIIQYSDNNTAWSNLVNFSGTTTPSLGQIQYASAVVYVGTYFDTTVKSATITLDRATALVATSTGLGAVAANRPMTGLHYAEFTITTLTGTPAVGFTNAIYNMTTATLLGGDANSVGYRSGGTVLVNNITIGTIASFVQGNRVDMAVDPANRLVWFRVNGGNWNNDIIANQNPVGAIGGLDFSGATLGRLTAAVGFSITGATTTAKFSAPFTGTAPTGFASIDAVQYITARSTPSYGGSTPVAPTLGPAARCGSMPSGDKTLRAFSPAGVITIVSGTVTENSVAVVGRRVDVYDRDTGDLIGTTLSGAGGAWSLPTVGRPKVRIVGSDPTTYNSIVYDNVAGV